jgi:hypothetical protein
VGAFAGAFGGDDGVDDVHAGGDLTKDSVAIAIEAGVVEVGVVVHVDEELGGGAVGDVGASHGKGAASVFEAILGFVLDRSVGGFLAHFSVEPAALNHEARDDPMENGAGVMVLFRVGNKVGCAVSASSSISMFPLEVSRVTFTVVGLVSVFGASAGLASSFFFSSDMVEVAAERSTPAKAMLSKRWIMVMFGCVYWVGIFPRRQCGA